MEDRQADPGFRDKLADILEPIRGPAGKAWDAVASLGLGPAFQHGSSEVMAAIYTGNGFVQYGAGMQPETGQEQPTPADRGQSPYGAEPEHDCGMER